MSISKTRMLELNNKKVPAMEVAVMLTRARLEAVDLIKIHLGEEPLLKDSHERYKAGMEKLATLPKEDQVDKTGLANMVQSCFMVAMSGVIGLEADEMNRIFEVIRNYEGASSVEDSVETTGGGIN